MKPLPRLLLFGWYMSLSLLKEFKKSTKSNIDNEKLAKTFYRCCGYSCNISMRHGKN
jgi:hypothetical protein